MASPIHKLLFSPPPSPPGEAAEKGFNLGSLTTLVTQLSAPPAGKNKIQRAPSPLRRSSSPRIRDAELDVESGEEASKSFVQRTPVLAKVRLVIQRLTPNVNIPRPVLRLLAFIGFMFVFVSLLSNIILPALSPLPQARPVAKKPQWTPKAYVPPQANAHPLVAPNPRAFRPEPHSLPPSVELLALQSFILESPSNHIGDVDPSKPLDAADLLGTHAARRLGGSGSKREKAWFNEISQEHANSIVLWYSSITPPHYVLEGISARHGEGRRPTLISTSQRQDGEVIESIFARLEHNLSEAPVIVIGGEVLDASRENMDELRSSGSLAKRLEKIGWSN